MMINEKISSHQVIVTIVLNGKSWLFTNQSDGAFKEIYTGVLCEKQIEESVGEGKYKNNISHQALVTKLKSTSPRRIALI